MSTAVEATPPPVTTSSTPTTATTQPVTPSATHATPTSVTTMSPVSVSRTEDATSPQTGDDSDPNSVRELVRKQLEYYFSKENLAGDFYLVSKMNADKYVNIAEIASFPKLHRLSQDLDLIKSVMEESPVMHVDRTGTLVRPTSLGIQRNTLMLREISSTAPEEEVRALFGDAKSSISSCRADVGDNWFVKFDTENDCMAAADVLRSAVYQDKPVRFRVKSENLMRSAYANMNASLSGDASASVGVGVGGYPGGYAAQPYPGYNPYLYQPMYPGQMMGNPYATYYPGAQQPYTPYGQQSVAQPVNTQSPTAKDSANPNNSFSLQQQPTPTRGRGPYNSGGGGTRGNNYRSGGGRGGRNNRQSQNNYQQQGGGGGGGSNSFQTRTTSFRQVNHNNSQASPANGSYQQQPSLFQQVGTGAGVTGLSTEVAPGGDNILSRLMNPGAQTNGTGARGQQRAYGGGRRGGGKSKQYGESAANELVVPQTAADPDDHNEFPALSVAHSTYSQPLSASQTTHNDGLTSSQTANGPIDATASQQQDHRPAVKYSMSQMKSFIENLKSEQLHLPEEYRATLKGLAPKTIHPLIRANPRRYLSALSQPPAIMTPESPFTAVAQVPCDLPALSIGEADSRGAAPPPVNYDRTLHGHQQKQAHHAFQSHAQHGAFSTSPSDHYQPPHGHNVSNAHPTRQQTHFRNASGGGGSQAAQQQKRSPQPNSLLSALAMKGQASMNVKSANGGNDVPADASTSTTNVDDKAASADSNHVEQEKLVAPSPERKESVSSPGAPPREGASDVANAAASNEQSQNLGKATPSAKGDEARASNETASTTTAGSK